METKQRAKLKRAQKKVKKLKDFYVHLTVYLLVNGAILGIRFFRNWDYIFSQNGQGFYDWVQWNIFGTALFWGIGLAIHALFVFKIPLLSSWEEQKIKEIIEKEQNQSRTPF